MFWLTACAVRFAPWRTDFISCCLSGAAVLRIGQSLHLNREKACQDAKVQIQLEGFASDFLLKVWEILSKTFLGQYFIFVLCIRFYYFYLLNRLMQWKLGFLSSEDIFVFPFPWIKMEKIHHWDGHLLRRGHTMAHGIWSAACFCK